MSKTEKEPKIIINDKEYVGDEITPAILMGAIQALQQNLKEDMDNRFKKMATKINNSQFHVEGLDGVIQEHQTTMDGFNNNFRILKDLVDGNAMRIGELLDQDKGENDEKD